MHAPLSLAEVFVGHHSVLFTLHFSRVTWEMWNVSAAHLLVKWGSSLPWWKLLTGSPRGEDGIDVSDLSDTLPLHLYSPSPLHPPHPSLLSVGVKSAYSPAPSTVYSQPPPPQRQVTALKPLAPSSSVSTSYNIYPVSTSVQQPPTPISSYTLGSSFSSTVAATSYSGKIKEDVKQNKT